MEEKYQFFMRGPGGVGKTCSGTPSPERSSSTILIGFLLPYKVIRFTQKNLKDIQKYDPTIEDAYTYVYNL